VDKFRELAAPVTGEAACENLLDALWRIDVLDDTGTLFTPAPNLQAAGATD